jgi:hypothetical protein
LAAFSFLLCGFSQYYWQPSRKGFHAMSSVPLVETSSKFPAEITIQSSKGSFLSPNTIEAVRELLINAEDQGQGLRLAEFYCEMNSDGAIQDGAALKIRGQESDRLVEVDPHSAWTGLRTAEMVAGAMAMTDNRLRTKALDEVENHARAHGLHSISYHVVIFPAAVLIYPSMPFRLLENALAGQGKLFPSDIDRSFRLIGEARSSSHSQLKMGALINQYLSALARSPQTAQVRRGLSRGVNASLMDTKFQVRW